MWKEKFARHLRRIVVTIFIITIRAVLTAAL